MVIDLLHLYSLCIDLYFVDLDLYSVYLEETVEFNHLFQIGRDKTASAARNRTKFASFNLILIIIIVIIRSFVSNIVKDMITSFYEYTLYLSAWVLAEDIRESRVLLQAER